MEGLMAQRGLVLEGRRWNDVELVKAFQVPAQNLENVMIKDMLTVSAGS